MATGNLLNAESPPSTEAVPVVPAGEPKSEDTPAPVDSPPPIVIPSEIAKAVEELTSDEFSVRQQATNRLLALGPPAFEPLIVLLHQVSGEASQRILLVLEQIWLNTPLPQADELELRLDEISLSFSPYQPAVKQILQHHYRLREARAASALRKLNAVVQLDKDENDRELRAKLDADLSESTPRIVTVILPRSWKGTPADIWHIRRLSHTEVLHVFYVRGISLSEADRLAMRMGFPELDLSERSEIFIGVVGNAVAFDNRGGCQISNIQADSPADIAGLQVGDRILTVDGVEIRGFEDLVEKLKSKRSYQPIEMSIERFAGEEPTLVTVIGLPWEVRRFPTPPPPPRAESLLDPPTFPRGRMRIYPN
jgi:hypothetical protein